MKVTVSHRCFNDKLNCFVMRENDPIEVDWEYIDAERMERICEFYEKFNSEHIKAPRYIYMEKPNGGWGRVGYHNGYSIEIYYIGLSFMNKEWRDHYEHIKV